MRLLVMFSWCFMACHPEGDRDCVPAFSRDDSWRSVLVGRVRSDEPLELEGQEVSRRGEVALDRLEFDSPVVEFRGLECHADAPAFVDVGAAGDFAVVILG